MAGVNEYSNRLMPVRGRTSTKPSARATSSCSRNEARLISSSRLRSFSEGVEHSSQAHALKALGCAYGQGYLFSPPLSAKDVGVYLRAASFGSVRAPRVPV